MAQELENIEQNLEKKTKHSSSNSYAILHYSWKEGFTKEYVDYEEIDNVWKNISMWYSSVLFESSDNGVTWNDIRQKGVACKKIKQNSDLYLQNQRKIILKDSSQVPSIDSKGNPITFCSNEVRRSKYTFWNFLPVNFLEQVRRPANFYFICIGILQMIRPVSISEGKCTIIMPLGFVFVVSMLKDAFEDRKRHKIDDEENNRPYRITQGKGQKFYPKVSKEINVGDLVLINDDEYFPADLLVVASDLADGSYCYVETANLDGETNLKIKTVPDKLISFTNEQMLSLLNVVITCEEPNGKIDEWSGKISITTPAGEEHHLQLSPENLLLRSSKLRNSGKCYGLVIYSGNDTKIQQNSSSKQARLKRSSVEAAMNRQILFMAGFQTLCCLLCGIGCGIWQSLNIKHDYYLKFTDHPTMSGLLRFFTWFIIFAGFVPISLIVSMEMVKFIQGVFIGYDLDMCHYINPRDLKRKTERKISQVEEDAVRTISPFEFATVQTSSLNEELGQVQFILSDKTGTLTANSMDFRKCVIGDKQYGSGETDISLAAKKRASYICSMGAQPAYESNEKTHIRAHVNFNAQQRVLDVIQGSKSFYKSEDITGKSQQTYANLYFRALSLCNTVFPINKGGDLELKASSPDEKCLLEFCSFIGFALRSRNPDIEIDVVATVTQDQESKLPKSMSYLKSVTLERERYEQLALLDFTSKRKRMTVIVRAPNGKIQVYTKGADSIITRLLKGYGTEEFGEKQPNWIFTMERLEQFGEEGLRTLMVATSEHEPSWWDDPNQGWEKRLYDGIPEIEGPNEKKHYKGACKDACRICLTEEALEKDAGLELVGATAIEDKLQDHVPQLVEFFLQADISVWVLTGDKLETAVNIGMAINLLETSMERKGNLLRIKKDTEKGVREEIEKHLDLIKVHDGPYGLVLSSTALTVLQSVLTKSGTHDYANPPPLLNLFLQVATACKSVVGCRLTPSQKAFIVRLIKRTQGKITLAVGDGANDEPMIKEAHIGVGIRGVEGTTAVQAADYAISQFSFLKKLIFVHGRFNYRRISILICYIFYKNALFCFTILWFNIFTGFSGQLFLLEWAYQLWNVLYSAFPIFIFAIFDRDIPVEKLLEKPGIYTKTQKGQLFNTKEFSKWIMMSFVHSTIIFFLPLLAYNDTSFNGFTGQSSGIWSTGIVIYTSITILVNIKLSMIIASWTWMHTTIIWGTILSYFVTMLILNSHSVFATAGADYYYVVNRLVWTYKYWLTVFFTVIAALLPDYLMLMVNELMLFKSFDIVIKSSDYSSSPVLENDEGRIKDKIEEKKDTPQYKPVLPTNLEMGRPKSSTQTSELVTGFNYDHTPGEGMRIKRRLTEKLRKVRSATVGKSKDKPLQAPI